ncbi:MAG TPA: MFS transporter [Magnetospirillaceae bacterium]|jgi:EmrB/QacA subfamily drug resistance transporter
MNQMGPVPANSDAIDRSRKPERKGLILATLCLAVLIAQVDTSVINLGVRSIGEAFHAEVGTLQWVVDAYNFTYAIFLLTGGLLADLFGRRRVFIAGAIVFTAASLVCATAPTISILIAGRALTGLGSALLMPSSLAIIRVVWTDARDRGRALGVWASCNGIAFALGPTIGGVLIAHLGWRSIFYLVVPLGIAAFALALSVVKESADPKDRKFDFAAQILGAVALGGLTLAAIEGHDAPRIAIGIVAVAALALIAFIRVEKGHGDRALVPLGMFRSREFRGAIAATGSMTFGMYGTIFLVPLLWQSSGMFDSIQAGLALLPMSVIFVAVSTYSGKLTEKLGRHFMTGGGVMVISSGLFLIAATVHVDSVIPSIAGLFLTGLGMGLATGPLNAVAVGAVEAARSGTASALVNVVRMVGATMGVAILGALFAIMHGGAEGLQLATLVGGVIQFTGGLTALRTVKR